MTFKYNTIPLRGQGQYSNSHQPSKNAPLCKYEKKLFLYTFAIDLLFRKKVMCHCLRRICEPVTNCLDLCSGHLICTLISENQGLEKLRSVSNLRKISGPAQLNFFSVDLGFFSVCHLSFFFQIYTINMKKAR